MMVKMEAFRMLAYGKGYRFNIKDWFLPIERSSVST